ncbi:MAG: DUF3090 family protein [Acidimicrobiales bacterium]|nr:DUF3090 family protein [Acidimicrobiales bacterium]
MSASYDFRDLEFLTVGTLGPKGQREFFLQARAEGELVSLKLEKQQVAALADYLDQVLQDLPEPTGIDDPAAEDLGLREPVVAAFTVGSLGIAYAEETDRLIVMAEAIPEGDEDDEDTVVPHARFTVSRSQVAGLIDRARDLVASGRPPCAYCGRPLEPRNRDWCPCQN